MTHMISQTVTDGAACKDVPKSIFYPDESAPGGRKWAYACRKQALAICQGCPVRAQCLDEEITLTVQIGSGRSYGIRGGMGAMERDKLIREGRRSGTIAKRIGTINHGTYAGAMAHRRRHEGACPSCAEAARIYQSIRTERRRAEVSA